MVRVKFSSVTVPGCYSGPGLVLDSNLDPENTPSHPVKCRLGSKVDQKVWPMAR
jgi:hypothetical protein